MTKIAPTIGRVVWFYPNGSDTFFNNWLEPPEKLAAIVSHVHSDTMVNLMVIDPNGNPHSRTSVALVQEIEDTPKMGFYCAWMPYQKGQAAKAEAAEDALATAKAVREAGFGSGGY